MPLVDSLRDPYQISDPQNCEINSAVSSPNIHRNLLQQREKEQCIHSHKRLFEDVNVNVQTVENF